MGKTPVGKLMAGFADGKTCPACVPRSIASRRRGWMGSLVLGLTILVLVPGVSSSGVLNDGDFRKVEAIKPLFQNLMGDLVQTSKRPDISREIKKEH